MCQRTEDRRLRYKYLEQSPQGACQGAPRSQQHRTASERGLGLEGSDTAVIGLSFESTTSVAPANPMPSMGASRLRCRSPCVTQAWRQWTDNSCGFSGCCNGIAKPCGTLLCSTRATAVPPTRFLINSSPTESNSCHTALYPRFAACAAGQPLQGECRRFDPVSTHQTQGFMPLLGIASFFVQRLRSRK